MNKYLVSSIVSCYYSSYREVGTPRDVSTPGTNEKASVGIGIVLDGPCPRDCGANRTPWAAGVVVIVRVRAVPTTAATSHTRQSSCATRACRGGRKLVIRMRVVRLDRAVAMPAVTIAREA